MYNQDVVFREVENTSRFEDEPKENGQEKMKFDEGTIDTNVKRSVKRYSPLNFLYVFVLSSINDEPRSIKEAVIMKRENCGKRPW